MEKAIEEGAAVVTESWAGVSLMTKPMFGVIILKLPQPVRLRIKILSVPAKKNIGGISVSVVIKYNCCFIFHMFCPLEFPEIKDSNSEFQENYISIFYILKHCNI